jgi:hypothetical protein
MRFPLIKVENSLAPEFGSDRIFRKYQYSEGAFGIPGKLAAIPLQ